MRRIAPLLLLAAVPLGACNPQPSPSVPAEPASSAVVTLAKAAGQAPGWQMPPEAHHALEVAYDMETAKQMWDSSDLEALPEAEGDPHEPGRYGSLEAVDFDLQVVALWSSGQSGMCPDWLSTVEGTPSAVVLRKDTYRPQDVCTDDFNAYRTVVAMSRDRLPSMEQLAAEPAAVAAHLASAPADSPVLLRRWTPVPAPAADDA